MKMYVNVLQLQQFNLNVYKLYLNKHYVDVNNLKKKRYVGKNFFLIQFSTFANILFYDSTSSATQEIGIVCCLDFSISLESHIYQN